MGQALRLSRTVPFPVCKVYVIVLILASRLPASVQRCLARMSHTARAPAVDDAADDDFAWVVARGSSTTGGCIGRRGLATSGKTPGEAFFGRSAFAPRRSSASPFLWRGTSSST